MTKNLRFLALTTIIVLALSACTFTSDTPTISGDPPVQQTLTASPPAAILSMTVTYDTNIVYNAVDQEVKYSYVIGYTGTAPLPGPVTVTDDRVTVNCLGLETVGDNKDANLDAGESITCTGSYKITQFDLDAGSFKTTATASVSGNNSAPVQTTVTVAQKKELTLTTKADPQTYSNVGDQITYSYDIKNTGNVTLGPVQFLISDDKFDASFNCGSDATSIAPDAIVFCSRTYTITQADLDHGSVTNTATVSDGTTTSASVAGTINKGGPATGSTVQHTVVEGEWLWQIARCYGADPRQVIRDNPLSDSTKLKAGTLVTVHNVGSKGTSYGTPCVHIHRVQSSDTWTSIASQYANVDSALLQYANPGGLSLGSDIKVPVGPFQYP